MKEYFKTIVLSDIHLGSKKSRYKDAINFLKHSHCENLILNGDILDKFARDKPDLWKKRHRKFVKAISKKIESENTRVFFIKGNSDKLPNDTLSLQAGHVKLIDSMVYSSFGKNYLVLHGDIFDTYQGQFGWLLRRGKPGHNLLFWFHRQIRDLRSFSGIKFPRLSEKVKSEPFISRHFTDTYEQALCDLAKKGGYDGVICGHVHIPSIKTIGGVKYMNSGDWVDSMSALVEFPTGEWSHVFYTETETLPSKNEQKIGASLNYINNYPSLNTNVSSG